MKKRRQQTPLESIARDANWKRGQIAAVSKRLRQVVAAVAPNSRVLPTVVTGMTRALERHLAEWEISARLAARRGTYGDATTLKHRPLVPAGRSAGA